MLDKKFFAQYVPSENLFEDKIILVTGAGDGIGKAVSLACAEHGATVILLGRTLQKLEAVYDEIEKNGWPKAAISPMNLESATQHDYQAMHDSINEEFGRLDGLLHNASELGPRTPLANYAPAAWDKLLQVNLTAPFLMNKFLMPLLQASEAASIVITSSSVGRKGRAYWGAYAITKAACENMMETLADELEGTSKVRVNTINPGATRTKMRASAYPAENPYDLPEPSDIVKPYLYLLSDDSRDVKGEKVDAQPKA